MFEVVFYHINNKVIMQLPIWFMFIEIEDQTLNSRVQTQFQYKSLMNLIRKIKTNCFDELKK